MPYNCFIIDDEPLAIEVIENHLGKIPQFEVKGAYTDAVKAFVAIKNQQIDLLFLDIEMPGFNGLDFIKSMKDKPEIIITTAYREFAVEGFDLDILDYLVKPIAFERFMRAIDKYLSKNQVILTDSSDTNLGYLMIRANRKHVKLNLADVLYIEGLKDYVKIFLKGEILITKESIGNFSKRLNQTDFIRIHKSYIISKDKITAITSHDVEIGKIEIPIGRSYKQILSSILGNSQ